jgi:hypothetical protein
MYPALNRSGQFHIEGPPLSAQDNEKDVLGWLGLNGGRLTARDVYRATIIEDEHQYVSRRLGFF